jgi:anti-sigma B factor antagonist
MKLEIEEGPNETVIRLSGELSLMNHDRLRKVLADQLEKRGLTRLTIDVSKVPYVDSSGLSALIAGIKPCRAKSIELVLTGVHGHLRELLHNTRLDSVFTIRESAELKS